jgi:hypothetical protein
MEQVLHRYSWIRIATPVLCAGLAALYCEHIGVSPLLTEAVRLLFGIVACTAIAAMLITGARDLADRPTLELRHFTRVVSRWVYVLIYILAIVRFCFYFLDSNQARGSHHLHHPVLRSPDDFQAYLWCCIIPLWSFRALVHSERFRKIRHQGTALDLSRAE